MEKWYPVSKLIGQLDWANRARLQYNSLWCPLAWRWPTYWLMGWPTNALKDGSLTWIRLTSYVALSQWRPPIQRWPTQTNIAHFQWCPPCCTLTRTPSTRNATHSSAHSLKHSPLSSRHDDGVWPVAVVPQVGYHRDRLLVGLPPLG